MRFCPKCGGVMVPSKEGGVVVLKCTRCGYVHSVGSKEELGSYRVTNVIEHSEKEKTVVISEHEVSGLPISRDVVCPKCGWREAYYWTLQTRAADEPATRFFKCVKCGHVWREYD